MAARREVLDTSAGSIRFSARAHAAWLARTLISSRGLCGPAGQRAMIPRAWWHITTAEREPTRTASGGIRSRPRSVLREMAAGPRARRTYLRHWYDSARRMVRKKDIGPFRRELAGALRYLLERVLRASTVPRFDSPAGSESHHRGEPSSSSRSARCSGRSAGAGRAPRHRARQRRPES